MIHRWEDSHWKNQMLRTNVCKRNRDSLLERIVRDTTPTACVPPRRSTEIKDTGENLIQILTLAGTTMGHSWLRTDLPDSTPELYSSFYQLPTQARSAGRYPLIIDSLLASEEVQNNQIYRAQKTGVHWPCWAPLSYSSLLHLDQIRGPDILQHSTTCIHPRRPKVTREIASCIPGSLQ